MKPLHQNILAAARANSKKMHEDSVARYYANPNTCLKCAKIIEIKDTVYATRKKRFCNHACAAIFANKGRARALIPCAACMSEFKPVGGRKRSITCSYECARKLRRDNYIAMWLRGDVDGGTIPGRGVVSLTVRKWLFCRSGNKCETCGWSEVNKITGLVPLQVNHVDGNSDNNRPENLELICPNCHSLTSTYGSLNRGRGRKLRHKKNICGVGRAA